MFGYMENVIVYVGWLDEGVYLFSKLYMCDVLV